ncbi:MULTISPECIES: hypothetical protein [unclassified Streptomyces]|uniref:hypothetical protein n=1 Tax=unclassified Streptomyces TaxID=2593676 RepID=UPI00148823AC|nr:MULTISPECIES: hypothetical protein [unclassified Streptomyces]
MAPIIAEQKQKAIDGLRALADFLESDPSLPVPTSQYLNVPLHTNQAVEEFASARGLTVEYDDEGNARTDLKFGPLTYHVYGYVDFAEHCERNAERNARNWAARKGLEIRPAEAVSA